MKYNRPFCGRVRQTRHFSSTKSYQTPLTCPTEHSMHKHFLYMVYNSVLGTVGGLFCILLLRLILVLPPWRLWSWAPSASGHPRPFSRTGRTWARRLIHMELLQSISNLTTRPASEALSFWAASRGERSPSWFYCSGCSQPWAWKAPLRPPGRLRPARLSAPGCSVAAALSPQFQIWLGRLASVPNVLNTSIECSLRSASEKDSTNSSRKSPSEFDIVSNSSSIW